MKKIYIILAVAAVGMFSLAGCTPSDNNTSVPSEQSSVESSEQVQNSEQTNESSEQSSSSKQTTDESSQQSSNLEQSSNESSEEISDESTNSNDEQSTTSSKDESTSDSTLTLSKVKAIIAENDDFSDILSKITEIGGEPDSSGGSGITWIGYWLDEDDKQEIKLYDFSQIGIYLDTYDSEGNIINTECLYGERKDIE